MKKERIYCPVCHKEHDVWEDELWGRAPECDIWKGIPGIGHCKKCGYRFGWLLARNLEICNDCLNEEEQQNNEAT